MYIHCCAGPADVFCSSCFNGQAVEDPSYAAYRLLFAVDVTTVQPRIFTAIPALNGLAACMFACILLFYCFKIFYRFCLYPAALVQPFKVAAFLHRSNPGSSQTSAYLPNIRIYCRAGAAA